jgi:hypothetical protein
MPKGLILLGQPSSPREDTLQRCNLVENVAFSPIAAVGSL